VVVSWGGLAIGPIARPLMIRKPCCGLLHLLLAGAAKEIAASRVGLREPVYLEMRASRSISAAFRLL
jgi:hypothetical protein